MYHDFESHTITRRSFLKGAGAVGAAGLLAACGGSSSGTAASASSASSGAAASGKGLSELFTYETSGREIESWNMLYSQQAIDFNVTTNIIDGLISFDNYGKPVPALAKSWEHNEDSTVWTFHLRDDVDWVDMNGEVQDHLTSKDFLVGFEWVLNAKKNQASNTSMPSTTVVGAADYYDKTYAMDDAAAAALTYDDMLAAGVGIDAPDDYTVVFTCLNPLPLLRHRGFLRLLLSGTPGSGGKAGRRGLPRRGLHPAVVLRPLPHRGIRLRQLQAVHPEPPLLCS